MTGASGSAENAHMPHASLLERFADILAEHTARGETQQIHPPEGPDCGYAVVRVCRCGRWSAPVMHDDSDKDAHRHHIAAELVNACRPTSGRSFDPRPAHAPRPPQAGPQSAPGDMRQGIGRNARGMNPYLREAMRDRNAETDVHSGDAADTCPRCGSAETHVSYEDVTAAYCRTCSRRYLPTTPPAEGDA